jgi:hypothetical protein
MRIWSLHPSYLDWMGLGAQWREALLAQKVTDGKTKGWKNHPQLDRFKYHPKPMEAVGFYLKGIHDESLKRDYKYNYSKILHPDSIVDPINLSQGQLQYEFDLLQERLKKRTPEKYEENTGIKELQAHSLFSVVPGLPEKWEKSYWVKKEV